MSNNQKWLIGGIAGAVLLCLCVGVACIGLGGLAAFTLNRNTADTGPDIRIPQVTTVEVLPSRPTAQSSQGDNSTPEATVTPSEALNNPQPAGQEAQETLNTLEKSIVPINDPLDLASRLEGKKDIPPTVEAPKVPYKVGDKMTFWVANNETNKNFQTNTTLRYVTDHVYFWIQDGVQFNQSQLARLCDTFEKKIYPTDRAFFGSEWTPGIDNDPHLYLVYTGGIGSNTAGYFSSADEIPPQAHPYSNAHEMFVLNSDNNLLGREYMYSTLAHEFQHMIHWKADRNEESWMNEGFSELAAQLNGYDVGGKDQAYVENPDMQLTYWPSPTDPEWGAHYGESFLFFTYFLDRFGEKATQAVVADPANGMDSIDRVLENLGVKDGQTGKVVQANDVFQDWTVATFLNDGNVGDGRYVYKTYQQAAKPGPTEEVDTCDANPQTRSVHQYGVDYIKINCSGSYTLHFQGSSEVGVLPESAHSGSYAFWSNRGDESDMTLTQEFDFSKVSGPLTLKYSTWYDTEKDYDYVYLAASEDGSSWQILKTKGGRDKSEDPSGNAYGWAYNGQSGGWIDESVDLSQFAGKKVQLRFEYITDAAVNNGGFMVDDVSIPEINYSTDFEKDDGGWKGDGFVRIQNRLPQEFRVALIQDGNTVSVQDVTLDANNVADIPLKLGGDARSAVLVVSGVTPFTTEEAQYQFSFQK